MGYRPHLPGIVVGLVLVVTGYGPVEAKPALKELIKSGNSSAQEGEYEAAIRAYKQAWKSYNSSDAAYNMGIIYHHELKSLTKAVHYYEKFLALEPNAIESLQVKKWLESVRRELNPDSAGQSSNLIESLLLTKIIKSTEDEDCRLGNEYLSKGKYEAAIGAYRKALVVNQSATACYNLALLYDYGLKYKTTAVYYYQRFLGMAPDSSNAYDATVRLERLKEEISQEKGSLIKSKAYKLRNAYNGE
jgi:tetratricopeptide (TPR) repeat protein